jgi:hypothetical protein
MELCDFAPDQGVDFYGKASAIVGRSAFTFGRKRIIHLSPGRRVVH